MKRVFSRSGSKPPKLPPNFNGKINANGIPIEYYRRGEVPPSKFRGPFNRDHQRRLAAWSFEAAMTEQRCRSLDLSLSPCTTLPCCDVDVGSNSSGRSDAEPVTGVFLSSWGILSLFLTCQQQRRPNPRILDPLPQLPNPLIPIAVHYPRSSMTPRPFVLTRVSAANPSVTPPPLSMPCRISACRRPRRSGILLPLNN